MAKTKISEYDATAANNTDIDSISIAEGMLPSNVNNSLRELMAHLKDMDAGTQALTSPQLTSADINGGTIDGAVIGGNSAAAVTATSLSVDNITIDGTEIDLSSGDLTLDVAGDIILDADGGDIFLNNAGTTFAKFTDNSGHLDIFVPQTNGDILFKGNDDGAPITALTLDMSDAGTAIFNHDAKFADGGMARFGADGDLQIYHDGSDGKIYEGGPGDLLIQSNGAGIKLQKNSGENMIKALTDGAVLLYYDNQDKLATTSTGVDITGTLDVTGANAATMSIIAPTDNATLEIRGGNSDSAVEEANVVFYQNNAAKWQLGNATDNSFKLYNYATSSYAVTIDSIGNVLVGKSATAFGTAGVELNPSGSHNMTRSGNPTLALNRLSSDGGILDFYKDSSAVGSIGNRGDSLFVQSNASNRTGLDFSGAILPRYAGGLNSGNDVDLGASSYRFKDLYLSNRLKLSAGGGIEFGHATSSASGASASSTLLDHYEEGTFTPTFVGSSSSISVTLDIQVGFYTRIGDTVFFRLLLGSDSVSGGSTSNLQINGLPFPMNSGRNFSGPVGLNYSWGSNNPYYWYSDATASVMFLYKTTGDNIKTNDLATGANSNRIWIQGQYKV